MKQSGKCPKCNCSDIFVRKGYISNYGDGSIMLGKTSFSETKVDHYICQNCGYMEQWLQDVEKLKKYL